MGTQGWNRYAYVGNRALSATDPTGFWAEWNEDVGSEPLPDAYIDSAESVTSAEALSPPDAGGVRVRVTFGSGSIRPYYEREPPDDRGWADVPGASCEVALDLCRAGDVEACTALRNFCKVGDAQPGTLNAAVVGFESVIIIAGVAISVGVLSLDNIRNVVRLVLDNMAAVRDDAEKARCAKVADDCYEECENLLTRGRKKDFRQGTPFRNCFTNCLRESGC